MTNVQETHGKWKLLDIFYAESVDRKLKMCYNLVTHMLRGYCRSVSLSLKME